MNESASLANPSSNRSSSQTSHSHSHPHSHSHSQSIPNPFSHPDIPSQPSTSSHTNAVLVTTTSSTSSSPRAIPIEKDLLKGVILIGGPSKGTRFRPLSLTHPKPLFPIAGQPLLYHHIAALAKLEDMK